MKIFLASFMEPFNFGQGEIMSITHGSKPHTINVKSIYLPLTPPREVIEAYNKMRNNENPEAGKFFTDTYHTQLRHFNREVMIAANQAKNTPHQLLPFSDGDTLCSWERAAYTNYRKILAPYLVELGYEVSLN